MTNKIILLAFFWLSITSAHAIKLSNIKLGGSYKEIITATQSDFGSPSAADSVSVNYKGVTLFGIKWDDVKLRFDRGVLTEVRCYSMQKSKKLSLSKLAQVASNMEATYPITRDYEEDGSLFYTGGTSPEGIGHLFTIFVAPMQGAWSTQIRFGPFRFVQ